MTLASAKAGFNLLTQDGAKDYLQIIFQEPLGDTEALAGPDSDKLLKVHFILLDNDAGQYYKSSDSIIIKVTAAVDKGYGYSIGPFVGYISVKPNGNGLFLDIQFDNSGHVTRFLRLPSNY